MGYQKMLLSCVKNTPFFVFHEELVRECPILGQLCVHLQLHFHFAQVRIEGLVVSGEGVDFVLFHRRENVISSNGDFGFSSDREEIMLRINRLVGKCKVLPTKKLNRNRTIFHSKTGCDVAKRKAGFRTKKVLSASLLNLV